MISSATAARAAARSRDERIANARAGWASIDVTGIPGSVAEDAADVEGDHELDQCQQHLRIDLRHHSGYEQRQPRREQRDRSAEQTHEGVVDGLEEAERRIGRIALDRTADSGRCVTSGNNRAWQDPAPTPKKGMGAGSKRNAPGAQNGRAARPRHPGLGRDDRNQATSRLRKAVRGAAGVAFQTPLNELSASRRTTPRAPGRTWPFSRRR